MDDLFSEATSTMPLHFPDKKVIVISSRVHPGETPAAHMFNGMLAFLLRQNDERALAMRRMFGACCASNGPPFKILPHPTGESKNNSNVQTPKLPVLYISADAVLALLMGFD